MYSRAVNAFSATRPGSWLVRHLAAKVDPALFRWSGGRATITGVPTLPMLTLTTTGRHSGLPRFAQRLGRDFDFAARRVELYFRLATFA